MKTITQYSILKTKLGDLLMLAANSALVGLYFLDCPHAPLKRGGWIHDPKHPVLEEAGRQIGEYLAGKRTEFSLPIAMAGTDFQNRVWQEIARIPFGETITYSDLALRAGKPRAVRAAGMNTGRNPISIIVPCHRVMGKDGSITGYAGTPARKRQLLDLEERARGAVGKH